MFDFKQYVMENQGAKPRYEPDWKTNFQFNMGVEMDTNRTYSQHINEAPKRKAVNNIDDMFINHIIPEEVMDSAQVQDDKGKWVTDYDKVILWARENAPEELGEDTRLVSEIETDIREDVLKRMEYSEEYYSRAGTAGKVMGGVGLLVGGIAEPAYIPTLFAGPARALTAAQFIKSAMLMGVMEGGAELLTIPQRQRWRTQLGIPGTPAEYGMEILMAGVFGGTLGAGGLGMVGKGVRKIISSVPTKANKKIKLAKQVLDDFLTEVAQAPSMEDDAVAHFNQVSAAIIKMESSLPPGMSLVDLGVSKADNAAVDAIVAKLRADKGDLEKEVVKTTKKIQDLEKLVGLEDVEEELAGSTEVLAKLRTRLDKIEAGITDKTKLDEAMGNYRALQELDRKINKMENDRIDMQDPAYLGAHAEYDRIEKELMAYQDEYNISDFDEFVEAQYEMESGEIVEEIEKAYADSIQKNDIVDNTSVKDPDFLKLQKEAFAADEKLDRLMTKYDIDDIDIFARKVDSERFVANMSGNIKKDMYKLRNAMDAVMWIVKHSDDPSYVTIAKRLAGDRMINNMDFKVVDANTALALEYFPKGSDASGWFINNNLTGKQSIYIKGKGYPESYGKSEEVVLHELIHASTHESIKRGLNSLDPEQTAKAVKRLDSMISVLDKFVNKMTLAEKAKYHSGVGRALLSIDDRHEFLTYGLTDSKFQEFLKQIPVDARTDKTLWTEFVEFLRSFFNLEDHTLFDEVIELSGDLLDKPAHKERLAGFKGKPKPGQSIRAASLEDIKKIRTKIDDLEKGKLKKKPITKEGPSVAEPEVPEGPDIDTFYGGTGDDFGEVMGLNKVEAMIDQDVELLQSVRGCISAVA